MGIVTVIPALVRKIIYFAYIMTTVEGAAMVRNAIKLVLSGLFYARMT